MVVGGYMPQPPLFLLSPLPLAFPIGRTQVKVTGQAHHGQLPRNKAGGG